VISLSDQKVIDYNKKFLDMFELQKDLIEVATFYDLLKIKFYNTSIYKNDLSDKNFCDDTEFCTCINKSREVRIKSMTGAELDCLMECQKSAVYDDDEKIVRVITFTDMTNQKKVQNRLIETQEKYESLLRKYALENRKPDVLMDLVNVEMDKFQAVEEIANARCH
jgi:hypothetical protein